MADTMETPSLGTGHHAQPVQANEFASAYSATCEQAVGEAMAHQAQEARAAGNSVE